MTNQPNIPEFTTHLAATDDQPRAPYYDKTLNYLQAQHDKARADLARLADQRFKIEEKMFQRNEDLETTRALLIEEWRQRRPANPATGEMVPPPFEREGGE